MNDRLTRILSARATRTESQGRQVVAASEFRHSLSKQDGAAFPPERNRYHLFVSHACPFSHYVLIARALKRLQGVVSMSRVAPHQDERGWRFDPPDPVSQAETLADIYWRADPAYSGKVTVPVLWDKHSGTIVSNDSGDIFRMLDAAFKGLTRGVPRLRPPELAEEIDMVSAFIRESVNHSVYRAGFAAGQWEYDRAVAELFEALDILEATFPDEDWLLGSQLTEVDARLFVTLIRFDAVYYTHFKCNWRHAYEYPRLWSFARRFYSLPGIAETVCMDDIVSHYYLSHRAINPAGVVPKGPDVIGRLSLSAY